MDDAINALFPRECIYEYNCHLLFAAPNDKENEKKKKNNPRKSSEARLESILHLDSLLPLQALQMVPRLFQD